MDGYSGYNQIALAEDDQQHTTFFTPHGLYCYTRMPFGLRNAGTTYQRMVDAVFKPWIGKTLEVYVDDMLVKSKLRKDHLQDLRNIFSAMKKYNMKVNLEKCTFGSTSGKFFGYLVTKRGIEVDPAKIQAIVEMSSPRNLKEVQKLNGSIAALGRFIARSSNKCKHFFNILKKGTKFAWTSECEEAFQKIKEYLATIPILQKPDPDEVLSLYIAATEDAVSCVSQD